MARRRLAKIASACSVVLLLATLALWARGYRARNGVWYSTDATRYGFHTYRGQLLLWKLSVAPNPTAMTWVTPTKMRAGFVWDSTPDAWYAPYRTGPMGIQPEELLDAPSGGSGIDRRAVGFRYVQTDAWYPRAQLVHGYPVARSTAIYIPHAAIALAAATLPVAGVIRARRKSRRQRRGLCAACGYDLRATPGRCPECGVVAGHLATA